MMPRAATARSATSGVRPRTWLGQTCARATPKAGGAAVIRSVTVSAVKTPSTEKPTTVTSGPSTSSSTSARPLRAALRASSIAGAERLGRLDERQALLALPVGRLDDDRAGDLRQVVVAADHPRPRLRAHRPPRAARAGAACSSRARRSGARSDAAARRARRSARRRPPASRFPGAMIPSISSAPTSRSIAGSSSVERMQRRSANGNPGAPGSRSTTASQRPRARAASSRPELSGTSP